MICYSHTWYATDSFGPCTRTADAVTDDELNARRLTTFLDRWLDKFPGYRRSPLYLTAESYGGHYVPQTARSILAHNRAALQPGGPAPIHLRGLLVINPYTDPLENAIGLMAAAWGHGLLPTAAYEAWQVPISLHHLARPPATPAPDCRRVEVRGAGALPRRRHPHGG